MSNIRTRQLVVALSVVADRYEYIDRAASSVARDAAAFIKFQSSEIKRMEREIDRLQNTKVEVGCVLPASDEHREDQDMKDPHSDPRT
jgi:hypothetical protein